MNSIRYRVKVYSDTEVRDPVAYFESVFRGHRDWWTLRQDINTENNCILVESVPLTVESKADIEPLYESITPEMYLSTSRTYRILK